MLPKKRDLVRGMAWAVFIVLCIAAAWAKVAQNNRRIAREIDAVLQREALQKERQDAFAELKAKLDPQQHGGPLSLEQVEQALPASPTLRLVETATLGVFEASWVHPVSGVVWEFRFDADDRLIGRSGSAGPVPAMEPRMPLASYNPGEAIGGALAYSGRWAWVAVFALFLVVRRWRAVTCDLLFALALVCTVADSLKIHYGMAGVFSNDVLYIDALMVAVSLAVMAATSPRIRPAVGEWLIPRRYSVRWLMGLTAVVAILVSLRWHGLVVGSVLAVGAAVYWAFRPRIGRATGKSGSAAVPS